MAKIRDYAVTIYATTTASMVCEMPTHQTGDLLVAFVNKDTAAAFTTPATWTATQTVLTAGAAGGVYTKRATSSSETVTFALTLETCCAVVLAIQNVNGTTVADAISASAASGADDTTLPLSGIGVTPLHNNTLVLHGLITDSGMGANVLPPWINVFAGDTGANSLCVSYTQQKTAGAITAPDHWSGLADDARGVIISVRDDGTSSNFDAYLPLSTTPATQISPFNGVATVDRGTWRAANAIILTSITGKTVNGVTVSSTADSGINPFRASVTTAGSSSTTQLSHSELALSPTADLSLLNGLLFTTWQNSTPRDYVDTGTPARGGKYLAVASSAGNFKAWVVGGQFSLTESIEGRNNTLIELGTTDTLYGTAGTYVQSSTTTIAVGSSGYYGAPAVRWNEAYLLGTATLAGGATGNTITFDQMISTINNGCGIIPLMKSNGSGATCWIPIKIGGIDPIYISCELNTFQFPRKADNIDYLDFHVSNNKIGFEFDGQDRGSGDVDIITFINCSFTSPSSYYWRFASTHDAGALINFGGSNVVNASVTLQSTVTLTGVTFINCSSFIQSGGTISDCSFTNTKVTSNNLGLISDSTFTSSGTGHAIELTTAGTYSLIGVTYNGYGSNDTTDAAIYNNTGGAVTINITDGDTPTIRNSAGSSTTVNNNVAVTFTGLKENSEVRILSGGTTTLLDGVENATGGTINNRSFTFTLTAGTVIDYRIHNLGYDIIQVYGYAVPSTSTSIPIQQQIDRWYSNP